MRFPDLNRQLPCDQRIALPRLLDTIQNRLKNDWQRNLPLVSRPFDVISKELGTIVVSVLKHLSAYCANSTVSRVRPVFRPNTIGTSILIAVAVPSAELESVVVLINEFDAVNHNYDSISLVKVKRIPAKKTCGQIQCV